MKLPTRPRSEDPRPPHDVAELTAEQFNELEADLERRRDSLRASIALRREQERQITSNREVGDEMDEASNEGTASLTSKLLDRDVRLLGEISHALGKFADASYGHCEGTGEPIGYGRLKLQPWARYSVAYQEELEQRSRMYG